MKTLISSSPRKLIVAFALTLVALTLAGCAPDSSSPAAPAQITGTPGLTADVSVENDTLHAWKEREKVRIAAEAVRSAPVYDSLHALWQATHSRRGKNRPVASTVADCEPLPYAADVQIVGPEGALFSVGPHKFYIPKGALTESTVITVELPVSNHAELDFAPHGLHFGTSYILLDYHRCDIGSSKYRNVVYTDENYNILETPPSYDVKNQYSVWAGINHFSHYVVAY